ncbi:hypothetical protein SAMN02927937_01435 [Paenimyroides aquimaris]|uniref:Uncharacterized protein n=1 Tax=Paenimyroides marinum TaxID=1159016 RepID=A0A1H6KY64_9FLAO|nr:hypothetical protein [Paenimyroides aquimaris]SEH78878.1 hypothetical protein SAMN02927937_01435 [Paenimyroides aquimaris]
MKPINKYTCHSGGAEGADACFEFFSKRYHINVVAYSYKTRFHQSENKYELNENEFNEGIKNVYKANEVLKRSRIHSYLKLLARNWFQVKYADEVFAVSTLKKQNEKLVVKGGTAWAIQMAVDAQKNVFVYDQEQLQWFYYDYYFGDFCILKTPPKITSLNFTGIGTRNINFFGMDAIEQLFKNTFG